MTRTRTAVAIVLFPILVAVIVTGGNLYAAGVTLVLALGVWELNRLMNQGGVAPSLFVSFLLLGILLLDELWPEGQVLKPGVALCMFLAMIHSLWKYRKHREAPLINFALTLIGGLYPGWLGAHLLPLRAMPDGDWWTLTVLLSIFAADSGAYFIGSRFGRHTIAASISPKKSWEGYAGGVAFGIFFGALFAGLFNLAAPVVTAWSGMVIGLVVALVAPLGDFAVSSFKRQVGIKDASSLIPGHGGMLDRLDSVLVGVVIGYYYILWFV